MQKRANEAVLLRGFYLRLLSRWYLVPLAVLAGAFVGWGIYFCARVVYAPAREYAAGARLYLEFSPDAAGNARDFYNAWTWKELITTDDILNVAMDRLIAAGVSEETERTNETLADGATTAKMEDDELVLVPGSPSEGGKITRAEVLASVTVRLPSDLRVMMLTVTRHDPESADRILLAMTEALSAFGETNENFREIRVMESTPALPVVTTDRTRNAVILGAVLGFLVSLFCLAVYYAMDDALYDPEMCERRFGLPMLGALMRGNGAARGGDASDGDFSGQMERELRVTCAKRLSEARCVAVLAASRGKDDSERVCRALTETLGARFLDGSCRFVPVASVAGCAEQSGVDAVVVGISYGKRNGAYVDHLLSALSAQGTPVAGALLFDADGKYLKRLYGL